MKDELQGLREPEGPGQNGDLAERMLNLSQKLGRSLARFQERTPVWDEVCRLTLLAGGFTESWFGRFEVASGVIYGLAQAGEGPIASGHWEARWEGWRASATLQSELVAGRVLWLDNPISSSVDGLSRVGVIPLAPFGLTTGIFCLVTRVGPRERSDGEQMLEWLRAPLEIALAWEERQEQWRRRDQVLRQSEARLRERLGDLRLMAATERLADEQALRETHRRLRALAVRMESIQEEERTRISREIHDELGQMITGLKMDLYRMEERLPRVDEGSVRAALEDSLVSASAAADEIMTAIQRIASELRPALLDRLGLLPALRFEAQKFQERTGTHVLLELPDDGLVMMCQSPRRRIGSSRKS